MNDDLSDDPAAGDPVKARNDALLRWAAQVALCDRIRTIEDFASIPMLIVGGPGGKRRETSLGAFCIDAKSAALLFREAWLARCERLAVNFKVAATRAFGVTEAEFAQAWKDYAMLAPPRPGVLTRCGMAAPQDDAGSLSADSFADAMGPTR